MQIGSRKTRQLLLCVILLAGTACSQRPSESDARQLLESYLRARFGSDTEVKVLSLHKTDGFAEEENGAKYYTMECQAEIVFPKAPQGYSIFFHDKKEGQSYKEDDRLRFLKTEKGWRLVSYE